MSANLSTKREVREQVRLALQSFVEDRIIDTDQLKLLVKSITETIELPTTSVSVQDKTLRKLLKTVQEQDAGPDVINRLLSHVPSSGPQENATTLATSRVKEDNNNISATRVSMGNSTPSASTSASEPRSTLFSLNALKERMSRKREELQQKQRLVLKTLSEAKNDPDSVSLRATLPQNVDHAEQPSLVGKYTEASKPTSVQPSQYTTQTPLPDGSGFTDFVTPSEVISPPPLKETTIDARTKINPKVTLTAAPVEEDLYAGLVMTDHHHTDFESHRGERGWRGRDPYRGGTQRPPYDEAFHPFYPPPQGYMPQRVSKSWQGYNAYDYGNYSHRY